MGVVVTYDVPSKHVELKNELFKLGYKDQIPGIKNCKIIYFPNTTLYNESKTSEQAVSDLQNICQKLSIELERCVATIWDQWYAICGKPFK